MIHIPIAHALNAVALYDCCFFLSIPMAAFRLLGPSLRAKVDSQSNLRRRIDTLAFWFPAFSDIQFSFVSMWLMFVTLLWSLMYFCACYSRGGRCGGAILVLARDGMVFEADECCFDEGAGFLRSILPWLAGHSRSSYITMSSEEAILAVPFRGVPIFLRSAITTSRFCKSIVVSLSNISSGSRRLSGTIWICLSPGCGL